MGGDSHVSGPGWFRPRVAFTATTAALGAFIGFTADSASCNEGPSGEPFSSCGPRIALTSFLAGSIGGVAGFFLGPVVIRAVSSPDPAAPSRDAEPSPKDSQAKASSRLMLTPSVGIGPGGVVGGLTGRF
jgi:hypothetical protein